MEMEAEAEKEREVEVAKPNEEGEECRIGCMSEETRSLLGDGSFRTSVHLPGRSRVDLSDIMQEHVHT